MNFLGRKSFSNSWLWLGIIAAAGLGLRLWLAAGLKSLTFDEMISFSVAEKPFNQIWPYVKWEMHPPLHYYWLHFWFDLFGKTEFSAHLSSVFLSVLAIVALYLLGKELFKEPLAALSAAALYALSPLFCFYGIWTRMYTLLFLTAVFSFYSFLKLIKAGSRQHIIWGALFIVSTVAALYTHLTAGLIPVIEISYLFYLCLSGQGKIKELFGKFWLSFLIIALVFLPWFWHFLAYRLDSLGGDAWYFNSLGGRSPFSLLAYTLGYFPLRYLTPYDGYLSILAAFSLLIILGFCAFFSIGRKGAGNLQIKNWPVKEIFFPLLVFSISFIGLFFSRLFVLRYAIIPAIGLFLFLGWGFFRASRYLRTATLLIFLILSVISFTALAAEPLYPIDWKGVAGFVAQNERPGDKIVGSLYTNIFSLQFYYRGLLPMAAPLDEKYRGSDLLLTTIKTNIYPTTNRDNIGQLQGFLGDTKRIFFIVSNGDGSFPGTEKIAEDWLLSRGFKNIGQWPEKGGDPSAVSVWLMERQ
jgi:uncharacterized membrane protein